MTRFQTSRLAPFLLALCAAILGPLLLAGCDFNDEEDRQDYEILRGDWRIASQENAFRIDDTDLTGRLNDQYETRVRFTFSNREDDDDRIFEIFANVEGGEDLEVGGDLRIDGEDDELDFFPNRQYGRFQVSYDILQSDRLVLSTDDERDGIILRSILLPTSEVGGNSPEVRIVIRR